MAHQLGRVSGRKVYSQAVILPIHHDDSASTLRAIAPIARQAITL
ncbi:hypothetical protein NVV94_12440 [Pseudomonas sp. LS1212]|nr:hypothetical protein [Pseudomonas sp. LS1212]UVJ46268.1 hypothetical protein NVV94_12440 [Pseudomonas sp. LS1212]